MTRQISVGLSYMYEPAFNRAILPLLEAGDVDALEWSFDTVSDQRLLPQWQQDLLAAFATAGRLYGHGVYYSLLNADWSSRQDDWLRNLKDVLATYPFRHLSEHFGFMSSHNAHEGCPLPVPLLADTLQTGRNRLSALIHAADCPVGIENLALAFSRSDVLAHGAFLRELVEPLGGFIVLDLHNLYCQSHNFGVPLQELILSYPLDRVREIHLSGGSWAPRGGSQTMVRRDTHDDHIPDEVLEILPVAIASCPNLDLVIVERLGDTLRTPGDEAAFRAGFLEVKAIVQRAAGNREVPDWPFTSRVERETENARIPGLYSQQQRILSALSIAVSASEAKTQLCADPELAGWKIGDWDEDMIDTAIQLGRKWGIRPSHLSGVS